MPIAVEGPDAYRRQPAILGVGLGLITTSICNIIALNLNFTDNKKRFIALIASYVLSKCICVMITEKLTLNRQDCTIAYNVSTWLSQIASFITIALAPNLDIGDRILTCSMLIITMILAYT